MKRFIETSYLPPLLKKALKAPRAATAPLRLLPDFIIIGAQRCGTTSLYRYLTQHPRVVPAFRKEVHFFCKNFAKGLNWYREHFPTCLYTSTVGALLGRDLVTGEASTDYILHPQAPQRVFDALPDVKLIVILRNPIDRAYSHYNLEVRRGREALSFQEAIAQEPERVKAGNGKKAPNDCYRYNYQHYSYLTRGVYADQLPTWTALFPRERFLILRSEDLYANPGATLSEVLGYLGLERIDLKRYDKYNYAGYRQLEAARHRHPEYPKMNAAVRQTLIDYFKPHNERLYALLERDLDWDR